MDLINQVNLGNNFVRPIEPINRLIQTHSKHTKKSRNCKHSYTLKKIERFLARKGILSGGFLGLNTLCRGCFNHTTFVELLYPEGDEPEKVCIDYKV